MKMLKEIINKNSLIAIFSWSFSFVFFFIYGDKIESSLFNSLVFYSTILALLANTDILCANNSVFAKEKLKIKYSYILIPIIIFSILVFYAKKTVWIIPEYLILLIALPAAFIARKKHLNNNPVDLIILTSLPVAISLFFYFNNITNSIYLYYSFITFLVLYVIKNFFSLEVLTTAHRVYLNTLNLVVSSRLDILALLLIGSVSLPNTIAMFKLLGVCFALNDIVIGRKIPKLIVDKQLTLKFQIFYSLVLLLLLASACLFYKFLGLYLDLVNFDFFLYFVLGLTMIFSSLTLLKISYIKKSSNTFLLICYSIYHLIVLVLFSDIGVVILGFGIGNIMLFLSFHIVNVLPRIKELMIYKKNNSKIILFSYAFNSSEEYKYHVVYQESKKINKNLNLNLFVINVGHNNLIHAFFLNLTIPILSLIGFNLTLLGQGKSYIMLDKNKFIKNRILLFSENTKEVAINIEDEEIKLYKKLLPISTTVKRNWNDYFNAYNLNSADIIIFYGSKENRKRYSFKDKTKIIYWHPIPQQFNIFEQDSRSNKIGYVISSGYAIKGLHYIIKLSLKYPNLSFIIFGNIDIETSKVIIKKYRNIILNGYTNFFSKEEKIKLKGFILPYILEGCSSSALNCIYSSMPTLTTEDSGIQDYISNLKITSMDLKTLNIDHFIEFPNEYRDNGNKFNFISNLNKLNYAIYNC